MTSTPTLVPSFIKGAWWTPETPGKTTDVVDAATGEVIYQVSTEGLDTAGAIDYARTVGQQNLQKLTIHERALIIKQIAQYLTEHKQGLYDISFSTGATQRDHYIDVDGGIGTLFTFSSKGRRELPNSKVIIDGNVEVLPAMAPSSVSTSTPPCPV